jgi:hypothetical protein
VYVEAAVRAAGAITTNYGVYVAAQTVGGTNYALYTNAGLNRVGDQLAVVGSADRLQLLVTGYSTQAVATPVARIARADAAAGVSALLGLTALGSGADGDGGSILFKSKTSTTEAQSMGRLAWLFNSATHASYKTDLVAYASDAAGEREIWRGRADGSAPAFAVLGASPIARYSATGDLRQCLIDFGLYTTGGASPLNLNGGALTAAAGTFTGDIKASGTGTNGLVLWDTVLAAYYRLTLTNGVFIITAV